MLVKKCMWETSFLQSIPSHSLFQYLYLDISNPWQISQFFFYILRYQGLTVFNICLFISCTLPSLPSFPLPNYFKPSACYISCLIKIKENIQFNKSHILVSTTCICVVCFRSWGLSRGWFASAPLTNRSSSMSYIFCTHKKQTLKSRPWWRKSMIPTSNKLPEMCRKYYRGLIDTMSVFMIWLRNMLLSSWLIWL